MTKNAGARPTSTASRLAAVQALYGIDRGQLTVGEAIADARDQGAVLDESGRAAAIDADLMASIVAGAAGDGESLDRMIDGALSQAWTARRLETLMRIILRAGTKELLERNDVPARVVISDYVDVAHAFWERGEPGMVNAVLDRLAHHLRAAEFSG